MKKLDSYHIDLDYTYIGYTSGKLKAITPILLRVGEHPENLQRYLVTIEKEKGELKKYTYYLDKTIFDLLNKKISFEVRFRDGSSINEILHIYRAW
jgi:hypothetical protein